MMSIEERMARQEQLEADGVAEGVRRFRSRLTQAGASGRGSQVGGARKLLQDAIDPLADALAQLCEDSKLRPGRKHHIEKWIPRVGPEVMAYLTARQVLDALARQEPIALVGRRICQAMLDEMKFRRLRDECPGLFEYRMQRFNTSNYRHKAQALKATVVHADIDTSDLSLPPNVEMSIGVKLIDLLIETTGLVAIERRRTRGMGKRGKVKDEVFLVPTEDTLTWLNARNGAAEFLWPISMPMVVPPLQWGPRGQRGGYRFSQRFHHALVRRISKAYATVVKERDMPIVYDALNAIQETAWRINPHVLSLINGIVEAGGGIAGVPELQDEPDPVRPHDIATNKESRKVWRKLAHGVKERNRNAKLKAMEFQKKYSVALTMQDDPEIYFPCTLDFRGRVYPVSAYLNPQGDDLCKSLLTFAEGKPLGSSGAVWLALHGANCLGTTPQGVKLSKATLQERVDAIVALTPDIQRIAQDPLGFRLWAEPTVDDPLQFYAFCVEWAGYMQMGDNYVCSLPVAMDGTCNGLQHFAAMFRDPVGGSAVNVVPNERPQDIYQRIADAVLVRLEQDAATVPVAAQWLRSGCVTRKLAKRPTMTFGYGSKKFGFQQQLMDYMKTEQQEHLSLFTMQDEETEKVKSTLPFACGYMSGLIWDALQVVVVSASQGMKWMQDAARVVAHNSQCVEWTVPATGFPVRQEYMAFNLHRVETILAGAIFKPALRKDTEKPDAYKQANAVAPNFVHSLDAAALQLTVTRCVDRGVSSFGMVHDSYATLPADAGVLAQETREAFIALYKEHDVITEFATALWKLAPNNINDFPVPPDMGRLDLDGVRESLYFFS